MLCIKGKFQKQAIHCFEMLGKFDLELTDRNFKNTAKLEQRLSGRFYFRIQFRPDKKSLDVTVDPSVTGTVELLAMITDAKVSLKLMWSA